MDFMKLKATLSLDSSEYEEGLDKSEKKAGGFKAKAIKVFKGVGVAAAAITTATVAVGGAFAKATGAVADYGDNVDKMSQKMGLSAEAYQEWDAVMQHAGTSMETMKAGMKTLANAAEKGNKAFERIGLTQEQVANMSQEELFEATISGLQNVEDTTERTYLAGQLLGRGATELGALLNQSAEDTDAMRQRVHELGGVMSDEAVTAAARYKDSLQDMTTAMAGAKRNIVSTFLPAVTDVMDGIGNLFSGKNKKGLGQIKDGVSNFVSTLSGAIPKVMKVGSSIVGAIGEAIMENLPALLEAGVQAIVELASGLTQAMPELVPKVVDVVILMSKTIIKNLPVILEAGVKLLLGLGKGIIKALPSILRTLGSVVKKLGLIFLKYNWITVGLKMLSKVWSGIKMVAPKLLAFVLRVVKKILNYFGLDGLVEKVAGVFESVKKTISDKIDAAKKLISGWIQKVKDLFPFDIGKIFKGWFPKIKLGFKKTEDSAETTSTEDKEYFAKAMTNPYMFDRETVFAAGEAGDEVLYGRKALMRDIAEATSGQSVQITNYITVEGAESPEDFAMRLVKQMRLDMRMA